MESDLPCGFSEEELNNSILNAQIAISKEQTAQTQKCQINECCEQGACHQPKQQQADQKKKPAKSCFKCKTNPAAIMYKGQAMCKACSLRNVEYKCRCNLQNKIKITSKDKLVVGLSGGMSSVALVNALRELQDKFQKHPLFAQLEVVHVDLSPLLQGKEAKLKYQEGMQKLRRFSLDKNFKLVTINLGEEFSAEEGNLRLRAFLNGFREGADQGDMADMLIGKALEKYAKDGQIIVKGTSGQRTAAGIFKYLVKGKGAHLEEMMWRYGNSVYPLREHLTRELQFYFYCLGLDKYSFPQPSIIDPNLKSINKINSLLQDFIDGLQDQYDHTCPTILRTSQRLKFSQPTQTGRCRWCGSHPVNQSYCLRCSRMRECWNGKTNIDEALPKSLQTTL